MGGSVGNQGTGTQGSGAAPNKGLGLAGGQGTPATGGGYSFGMPSQPSQQPPMQFNPLMPGGVGNANYNPQRPIQPPQVPPQQQAMNPFFTGIGALKAQQAPGQMGIEPPNILYGDQQGQEDPRMQMLRYMQQFGGRLR